MSVSKLFLCARNSKTIFLGAGLTKTIYDSLVNHFFRCEKNTLGKILTDRKVSRRKEMAQVLSGKDASAEIRADLKEQVVAMRSKDETFRYVSSSGTRPQAVLSLDKSTK